MHIKANTCDDSRVRYTSHMCIMKYRGCQSFFTLPPICEYSLSAWLCQTLYTWLGARCNTPRNSAVTHQCGSHILSRHLVGTLTLHRQSDSLYITGVRVQCEAKVHQIHKQQINHTSLSKLFHCKTVEWSVNETYFGSIWFWWDALGELISET